MSRVVHILLTDYKVDSRVKNETESLNDKGYKIDVFCLKSDDTYKMEHRKGVKIIRYGLLKDKIIKILNAYIQFIFASYSEKYRLVHAHDFTALPVGFIISRLKGIPLIYDSHELWSESEHENYPRYVMKIAYRIEKYCAKKSDYIITVSDSIKYFLKIYFNNQNIATVRNIPSYTYPKSSNILRDKYSIPIEVPIFIYQGLISKNRGIDIILDSVNRLKNLRFKCIFLGDGPYLNDIQAFIRKYDLESRIITIQSVPQDELLKYIKSADIGLHAISNTCLNHEYCLPNKLFEYIHAGVGVICTNLKEMSKLVQSHNIGLTFNDNSAEDLSKKMQYLINNNNLINQYKTNSKALSMTLTWDKEFLTLEKVYEEVLSK